jgi:hypothetical protein
MDFRGLSKEKGCTVHRLELHHWEKGLTVEGMERIPSPRKTAATFKQYLKSLFYSWWYKKLDEECPLIFYRKVNI